MSTLSKDQTILERLSSLEDKDEAKTREIKKLQHKINVLQNENLELKSELAVIQDDNMTMKEKVKVVEKKMADLDQVIPSMTQYAASQGSVTKTIDDFEERISALEKDWKQNKKDVTKKISSLTTKVDTIDDFEERISALEKDWKQNKKDVTKKISSLTTKVDTNDNRMHVLEKKVKKNKTDVGTKIASLTSKVVTVVSTVNQLSGLHRILNRAMVDREAMSKKVDDIGQRTNAIETRQGNISQSIACVALNTSGDLFGLGTKLDRCDRVYVNRGVFDQGSCRMVPQCDGDYGVGVWYGQRGEGRIGMCVNWDGSGLGVGRQVGRTNGDMDVCFGMDALSLKKGQKVWVRAWRWEGVATIGWCRVFFWLLG